MYEREFRAGIMTIKACLFCVLPAIVGLIPSSSFVNMLLLPAVVILPYIFISMYLCFTVWGNPLEWPSTLNIDSFRRLFYRLFALQAVFMLALAFVWSDSPIV